MTPVGPQEGATAGGQALVGTSMTTIEVGVPLMTVGTVDIPPTVPDVNVTVRSGIVGTSTITSDVGVPLIVAGTVDV